MAPLPKRRHSTRRGGKRNAAIRLKILNLILCPNCRKPRLPHRVCPACGYYNTREIVKKKTKLEKKK